MRSNAQERAIELQSDEDFADRRRARMLRLFIVSFIRNRTAVFGAVTIIAFTVAALIAPLLPTDPLEQDYDALMLPPSIEHPIGTDSLGRDNLIRLIHGGRVSLQVGLLAMLLATTVGVTVGLVAGYFGKWVDSILMRIVDVILAFPALLLAILMVAILGP